MTTIVTVMNKDKTRNTMKNKKGQRTDILSMGRCLYKKYNGIPIVAIVARSSMPMEQPKRKADLRELHIFAQRFGTISRKISVTGANNQVRKAATNHTGNQNKKSTSGHFETESEESNSR